MQAKKSLGQNFLRDGQVVKQIVDALEIREGDCVIEIGPGTGSLTVLLVERATKVIAVEFDRDLIPPLKAKFGSFPNFELQNEDALRVSFVELARGCTSVKVVANLPYNISTPILQRLIDQKAAFTSLVLMFQKEVAERITAKPGSKKRGFLSVLTENSFIVDYLFDVAPQAFHPKPKVWSAVVKLTPRAENIGNASLFRKIVSSAFAQKRKTILNNLRSTLKEADHSLNQAGIDPIRRAETLDLAEWRRLITVIGSIKG